MEFTGKEVMNLGRTSRLYHEGRTPEEISQIVKYPIEKILVWIDIIKKNPIQLKNSRKEQSNDNRNCRKGSSNS